MARYEVVVGGTRTVYRGSDRMMASSLYSEYVQRRMHTTVTKNGQVLMEAHGNAMTARRAHVVRTSEDRFERARETHDPKKYKRGGGYTPEEYRAIARKAGISRAPSNRAKGKLEAYEFKHNPPDKVFAYYDMDRRIVTTWTGDKLGDIVWRGVVMRRGFGGGGKTQAIRVRGINGVMYHGNCNLNASYCRLRRMASTRR